MSIRVSRVILYVKDVARVAAFYKTHFGMRVLPGSGEGWVELSSGKRGCDIAFHKAASSQKSGAAVKIVFGVVNVLRFKAEREAGGLKFGPIHRAGAVEFCKCQKPGRQLNSNLEQRNAEAVKGAILDVHSGAAVSNSGLPFRG